MFKRTQAPARVLLTVLTSLICLAMLSGVALADTPTEPGGARFTIVEATSTRAYFSVNDGDDCNDTDENCTVVVTSTEALGANVPSDFDYDADSNSHAERWRDLFVALCSGSHQPASRTVSGSDESENEAFETCWTAANSESAHPTGGATNSQTDFSEFTFDVQWPIITPDVVDDKTFDISPYCQDDDNECAVELYICYNPRDCRDEDERPEDSDEASDEIGEFWDNAGSCLYDDDEEEVWDCINDEFEDWLDDSRLSSGDDFDDLIDELDDNSLGLAIEDDRGYDDDLNEVGFSGGTSRPSETVLQRYQRRWRSATPKPVLQDMSEVDLGGYSFRPSADDYLTVDITGYFDFAGTVPVCDTTIGCVSLSGKSSFFRDYLTNFFLVITDRKVTRCMDRAGYDPGEEHAVALNNADLAVCDERIAEAIKLAPAENIGADYVVYEMYSMGLLTGIVTNSTANTMRANLESARVRVPEFLCAAGFSETDMVVTERDNPDPWYTTTARRPEDVCDT